MEYFSLPKYLNPVLVGFFLVMPFEAKAIPETPMAPSEAEFYRLWALGFSEGHCPDISGWVDPDLALNYIENAFDGTRLRTDWIIMMISSVYVWGNKTKQYLLRLPVKVDEARRGEKKFLILSRRDDLMEDIPVVTFTISPSTFSCHVCGDVNSDVCH